MTYTYYMIDSFSYSQVYLCETCDKNKILWQRIFLYFGSVNLTQLPIHPGPYYIIR